jgi:ectoine hydroxylase-related dioxygenase (phytanoyl-CoA dioxygenase family)
MTQQKLSEAEIYNLSQEIVNGQGYVVIPNLISRDAALTARDLIIDLTATETIPPSATRDNKVRLYGLIYKGEIFEQLVQHPVLLAIIEAILGKDIILGGFSAHILYPGATRMGVHVDYPYWAMSAPFPTQPILEIQVIWLIEDFTEDNGAPLFAANTQKLANKPNFKQFEAIAQKITGEAGSVILSHGLCWHDTSVNQSDRPRVSLLGNYTPQYIHPLENNLFDFQPETLKRATPQLKKLLRHDWRSQKERIFGMSLKMRD